jgi:hypothetical protein
VKQPVKGLSISMAKTKSEYAAYIPKNENGTNRKGSNFTSLPADSIPATNGDSHNYSRIPKGKN